jgi:hypothetical protein
MTPISENREDSLGNRFCNRPNVICGSRIHRRGYLQRRMHAAKILAEKHVGLGFGERKLPSVVLEGNL